MSAEDDLARLASVMKVATVEELEKVDLVVCMRVAEGNPFRFDDNKFGRCADCGHAIFWRPYNPLKPLYVCVHCAIDRVGLDEAGKQRIRDIIEEEKNS